MALAFALAAVTWFLYQRHAGLQPTVFADEWYYSKMSRLMPLPESMLPSWLYLWLFSASSACGDGFLECVRIGNLAFFMLGAPFVYLIARRHAGQPVAAGVAVLSTLAPLNTNAAYFMPEAMYYFGFCVLSWVALQGSDWRPLRQALASGAVLGLMSLVKVHALFLLPSLCLYLLLDNQARGGRWFLRGLAMAALAVVATFALKFGLGWVLAGDAGLTLFGYFYESTRLASDRLALLVAATVSARGHLMTLALMYALPLAILACEPLARLVRRGGNEDPAATRRHLLHLYTLLMLGAAAGLAIVYTAGLHVPGSREGFRLHMRYYNFVFPLLLVVAAAAIAGRGAPPRALPAWLRWGVAALLGLALVMALSRLQGYTMNVVDGPDIFGFNLAGRGFRIVLALQLLVLLAWAARLRAAPLLFLCLALPAAYLVSQVGLERKLDSTRPVTPTDVAARFVHDHVPPNERSQVVIAGVDLSLMIRAQFHLDHPDSTLMTLDFGPVHEYQLPLNKKWMLLLGEYQVPDYVTVVKRTPWWTFVRLPDPEPVVSRVALSAPPDPAIISSVEGLSKLEPWGRWSEGKRVVFHYAQPLPRRIGLVLSARAYDVNASLPFKVTVGGQTREFKVGWHQQEIGLHFDTGGDARTVEIEIPQPVSPAERGNPGDTRKLGIGIGEIVITDAIRPAQAAR
jgi:phosphoglycerol transferase